MDVNVVTAIASIFTLGLVCRGFFPVLRYDMEPWVKWVVIGIVIFAMTSALRSSYWDLVQYISGDTWPAVLAATGGQKISSVFNIGLIVSCCALLKARWYLIPEDDRHHWHWWNSWMHPSRLCFTGLIRRKRD
jgi:hypothetical protein